MVVVVEEEDRTSLARALQLVVVVVVEEDRTSLARSRTLRSYLPVV